MQIDRDFKEFLKYSALNVLGMLGLSCYILADTFFVAKGLLADGLAALNLAIPVYSFIHGTGLMLGMGGATRYSVLKSQRRDGEADKIFTNVLYLSAAFAALFVLTGIFLSEPLTAALGANTGIFEMTNTYLKVLLLFSPAFLLNDVLICFVRNDGNPKLAMTGMICGSFFNIIMDYILIFPMRMGIFGAVLATGVSPVISIAVLSRHLISGKNRFHAVRTGLCLRTSGTVFVLGLPSLITELASGVVIIVFNAILLRLQGNTGVAAYGVIANLALVLTAVYTGIAQGIQPLLSTAHGLGDTQRSKRLLRYAIAAMACLSTVVYLCIICFAEPIVRLFNSENNRQLQSIAETGLKIYFTGGIFAGFNIILSVFFTSAEKAVPAHILSLLRGFAVIISTALLLAEIWGLRGVWLSFPVTEILSAILGILLYLRMEKIHNRG